MKVSVLGASGFVGRHLVESLLNRGHEVIAVARSAQRFKDFAWTDRVHIIEADLYGDFDAVEIGGDADAVVDLVWPGLPNYFELFHYEQNLPNSYQMLKRFVTAGYRQILVVGTCFEYGMQSGALSIESETTPHTAYGFSKDSLRRELQFLQRKSPFLLQWARLFYVYGTGQNESSLLPQLDKAIGRGDSTFPMSGGEQLRDFIAIEEATRQLCRLVENPQLTGCFNVCSGKPTSVRSLVENRIRLQDASIELDLGRFPYPTYESMAFWGEPHTELLSDDRDARS